MIWNRRGRDAAAVLFFPYVIETLRTESFLAIMPSCGCFSLTDMVAAMNSGIRVRESIRSYAKAIDARGRSAEGRSMDRDLGTPKKSQESTSFCAAGICAAWAGAMLVPVRCLCHPICR
jgi:hypothetical protein